MDILNIKELTARSNLGSKHNIASGRITAIKGMLYEFEQLLNNSLEEAATSTDVSEANIDAALESLRIAHHTLKSHLDG